MLGSIIIDIDPILAQLGPLTFRWYGLMYVVGIAVGLWVAMPYGRQRGLTEDDLWYAVWPSVIAGFVGARLYFVVQQPLDIYLREPWRIMATWEGGMAFYGAIFGVLVSLFVVSRLRRFSYWTILDAGVLFAVVGQSFGRIGNIINGDIIGPPTDLPWGFQYVHPRSFVPDHNVAYHPAAAYELLSNMVLFAGLWALRNRLPRPGLLAAFYLILYSISQFVLFFIRTEPEVALGLKQAQWTALVVLAGGAVLMWWLLKHPESEPEPAKQRLMSVPKGPSRLPPKRRRK